MNFSSNVIDNSNDKTNFPHKLLIDRPVSRLCKTCAYNSSVNIKVSGTPLSKIV